MEYSYESPLNCVQPWLNPVFDAHIHVWKPEKKQKWNPNYIWKLFIKWINIYFGRSVNDFYCLGMLQPDIKKEFSDEIAQNIVFAYYLSVKAFALFDTKKLLEEIDIAQENDYSVLKIWFAPRMIDYAKAKPGFRINDSKFDKIYEKIEDYGFKSIIHVADPDLWYLFKYTDIKKYGTKKERIYDFCDIMDRFPKIKFISAHLGSWPEQLTELGNMLDKYPQLYVDSGSTRWMIRELGKDRRASKMWFQKYKERILFGSDLSLSEKFNPEYITSRYWSHKVFWETNHSKKLPFIDTDSPFGSKINGLGLDDLTLSYFYYKNAMKLFNLN